MSDFELLENLKNTVEADPTNFQARRELAVLCMDMGYEKVALNQFNSLSQIFTQDADIFFNIGICWEKLKNDKMALKAYQRAIELNPNEIDYVFNLALVYEKLGDLEQAKYQFKKAICIDPEDYNSFFCIGCIFVKEGDTLESIVIRFYGSFDMNKVNAIQDANKMANPNALSIGQKLTIPMNH